MLIARARLLSSHGVLRPCRGAQPLYGFASKDPARFLRAAGHGDPFYVQDPLLSFDQASSGAPACSLCQRACVLKHACCSAKDRLVERYSKCCSHTLNPAHSCAQVIDAPLPKVPIEVGVVPHWLAVDGVQPAIPENAPLERPRAKRACLAAARPAAEPAPDQAPAGPGAAALAAPAAAEGAARREDRAPAPAGAGAWHPHAYA